MTETHLTFSPGERRKTFLGVGILAVLLGVTGLIAGGSFGLALVVVLTVPLSLFSVNRALGETVLTEEGMRFRTLFSRRRIPWSTVTAIEVRTRTGRGSSWSVVRAHREHGRKVVLPGVMMSSSTDSDRFRADLDTICSHWHAATGRTDRPVFRSGVPF